MQTNKGKIVGSKEGEFLKIKWEEGFENKKETEKKYF